MWGMGSNLPNNPTDRIAWAATRAPVWVVQAGSIGLTEALADEVAALTAAAQQAHAEALAARSTAQAATFALHNAIAALSQRSAHAIAAIKNFAALEDDPEVYTRAQIEAPAPRGTRPPPPQPRRLEATLHNGGVVKLTWRGRFGRGTYFQIFRAISGSAMSLVAATAAREHTDTLPPGCGEAVYSVRAVRASRRGGRDITGPHSIQIAIIPTAPRPAKARPHPPPSLADAA